MVRVTVMYPNNGAKFDMEYYLNKHIPLVHKLLDGCGLVRTEVDRGLGAGAPGAPAPYCTIAYLVFNSMEELQKGMAQHDPTLAADVPNFTTVQPLLQISEVLK